MSLQQEDVQCVNSISLPSTVPPSVSTGCFRCSTRPARPKARPTSYPPYNIERTGENAYRLTLAVAGFGESELSIESRQNALTIKGAKEARNEGGASEVLYQGIAARAFERRFQLADHVQVTGARLENGLLHVDLVREIPEAQRPRQIPIGHGAPQPRSRRPRESPKESPKGGLIGSQNLSGNGNGRAGRPFCVILIAEAARPWARPAEAAAA